MPEPMRRLLRRGSCADFSCANSPSSNPGTIYQARLLKRKSLSDPKKARTALTRADVQTSRTRTPCAQNFSIRTGYQS